MKPGAVMTRAFALTRDYGILVGLGVLVAALALASPNFLSPQNLLNVLSQAAPLAIVACGATLAIIAGGFDLSTGSVYALAGVISALVTNTVGLVPGILAGVSIGLAVGLINGVIIARLRINSFVATLASGMIVLGAASVVSGGRIISVTDPDYRILGSGSVLGIRYITIIAIVVAVVLAFVLHRTVFGRHVFAVGGGAEAARLSGIRVLRIPLITFAISGTCAALAGVLASSRVASGQAMSGGGIELTAIAAIVIGGTSILGGQGAIWRTIAGVLLLTLIGNGFNVVGIDPFYRSIFTGAIILVAVGVDALARRKGES